MEDTDGVGAAPLAGASCFLSEDVFLAGNLIVYQLKVGGISVVGRQSSAKGDSSLRSE
jgi:hypothetical protein